MRIGVVTNELLKEELLSQGLGGETEVNWLPQPGIYEAADGYIDLLFDNSKARLKEWEIAAGKPVFVNAVSMVAGDMPPNFIRINGWPTFLKRPLTEATCTGTHLRQVAEQIFSAFNKKIEWTPDIPGFITARVICMIINEAYFALNEKVSTIEEIDTAMKLGTNYPYGPFEWCQRIGPDNIIRLLTLLAKTNSRYEPSDLLKKAGIEQ
jgi:3-hydroxybutyryl-CoA dehydrogenase